MSTEKIPSAKHYISVRITISILGNNAMAEGELNLPFLPADTDVLDFYPAFYAALHAEAMERIHRVLMENEE